MPRNELLRQRRVQRNWRQSDIAEKLGTAVTTIQRWERGSQQPSVFYRTKLCMLFNLTPQELGLIEEEVPLSFLPEKEPAEASLADLPLTPAAEDRAARGGPDRAAPVAIWAIPHARNPHFTGRVGLLAQLKQRFFSGESETPTRQSGTPLVQTLKGLGGIGKTQLALEYAYRSLAEGLYTHAFWITAASAESLLTSMVALAELLPDGFAQRERDQHKLGAIVKRWLECCPDPWLLIVDNADDLSLIPPYLPVRGHGHILLTTRASAVGTFAPALEVDNMGIDEGIRFLLQRSQRLARATPDQIAEARQVVVALTQFPLALDQAAAYIEETGCRISTYLRILQEHRLSLLARRGIQAHHYPDSVVTTWSLSFQRLEQDNPAAVQLLRLCAFLTPDRIPEELLIEGAAHWPAELQQAVSDPLAFEQLFQDLLTFSLVKRQASDRILSLHRLVQVIQRDSLEPQEQRQWAERVVRAVNTIFPQEAQDVACWPRCLRYLEQAQACATLIQRQGIEIPEAAEILERTAIYLRSHASHHLAEPLFQQALALFSRRLGSHHPRTARCQNHLALLYLLQGNHKQAEPLFQQTLALLSRHLGSHHLDTAECQHNLALLYLFQGKSEQAEPLLQSVLALSERLLGAQHEKTAHCLADLADVYRMQDKLIQAAPLYLRALSIWEHLCGPLHPQAVKSLTGLAEIYVVQGRYSQAEALYRQMLAIREQQYAPDHPLEPYTLTSLADLYVIEGRDDEAQRLYEQALPHWEVQADPPHPNMADTLHGLATVHRNHGRYEQAGTFFQRALEIRERYLVPTHPDLTKTLHGFALLRHAQGYQDEARTLYERALVAREQTLGPTHPLTVETRTRLTTLLLGTDQMEEKARQSLASNTIQIS